MTREEIIEGLYHIKNWECNGNAEMHKVVVAAIEVLDQEPVLDKIRAEIMQLDYDTETVDYDYNDMAQTEEVHTIYREEVLQIIDKYKAESEEV